MRAREEEDGARKCRFQQKGDGTRKHEQKGGCCDKKTRVSTEGSWDTRIVGTPEIVGFNKRDMGPGHAGRGEGRVSGPENTFRQEKEDVTRKRFNEKSCDQKIQALKEERDWTPEHAGGEQREDDGGGHGREPRIEEREQSCRHLPNPTKSPRETPSFVLPRAGFRRRVVQIKATEKEDLHPL